MLGKAFLSYRRSDAEWVAQSLYVQLRSRFGPGQLFMDVNSIEPGSRAQPDRLRDELASSTIVVAIVGPGWLRAADEFGYRRLDDPDDWVRCELGAALDDGKRILIVRAEDAVHPPAKALPEPLVRLASIQSTHRSHSASWPDDVNAIERLLAAWGIARRGTGCSRHARTGAGEEGPASGVEEIELVARLKEMPYWEPWKDVLPREHPKIRQELRRSYQFGSFEEAIAFMSATAPLFTRRNHHPRWGNEWKTVHVRLSTWDADNRITAVDLDVAGESR